MFSLLDNEQLACISVDGTRPHCGGEFRGRDPVLNVGTLFLPLSPSSLTHLHLPSFSSISHSSGPSGSLPLPTSASSIKPRQKRQTCSALLWPSSPLLRVRTSSSTSSPLGSMSFMCTSSTELATISNTNGELRSVLGRVYLQIRADRQGRSPLCHRAADASVPEPTKALNAAFVASVRGDWVTAGQGLAQARRGGRCELCRAFHHSSSRSFWRMSLTEAITKFCGPVCTWEELLPHGYMLTLMQVTQLTAGHIPLSCECPPLLQDGCAGVGCIGTGNVQIQMSH